MPVVIYPDFSMPFFVKTGASSFAVGTTLLQKDSEERMHPAQYAGRTMSTAEKNYSICQKEALAVVFALKKFCHFLLSTEAFTFFIDHQAL